MGFTALNFILAGPDAAAPAHQIGQAELLAREVLPEVAAAAAA